MVHSSDSDDKYDEASATAPSRLAADQSIDEQVLAALRTVYDPEIPVNILDLGLIYGIDCDGENNLDIRMTLTAPACPVAGAMPGMVENAVKKVPGVANVQVELVWDPPWTQERMSDEARVALNMYE